MSTNPAKRILIVDDEEHNVAVLQSMVESLGHEAETAHDGIEAMAKLRLGMDLILLDMRLPRMDGTDVVREVREGTQHNDIPIIMLLGLASREDRIAVIEAGANDFIAKPVDKTELSVRVASQLAMKEKEDALKRHLAEQEVIVEQRTAELRQALKDMADSQRETYQAQLEAIEALVLAAESKDPETANHIKRMGNYSAQLARALKLKASEVEIILQASPMHDVGKIGVPESILLKPGKLTPDEVHMMQQHTVMGARILGSAASKLLRAGKEIALSHHEKWDGSGYPHGLAGEDIPLRGRICAVADVFDALTSERSYKRAFSNDEAIEIMRQGSGKHFEPRLVDLFSKQLPDIETIQKKYRETPEEIDDVMEVR